MRTRKEMKASARKVLKRHYWIFVAVCLTASFLGAEFSESMGGVKMETKVVQAELPEIEETVSTGATTNNYDMLEDVRQALQGDTDEAMRLAEERIRQSEEESREQGDQLLGRSRGVLASMVNSVTSGSITVKIIAAINSISGSTDITLIIMIGVSLLLAFAFWFFLTNMFKVISRRIFLEGRTYDKVPFARFIFLLRIRKWTKASRTMFVMFILYYLWSLTIIGAIIKRYSYYMVPYIVAENPNIKPLQAITLSRKMMNGHKRECFIFEMSYIGWSILGGLTLGISTVLFSNPYKIAAFSEYYTEIRKLAKEKEIDNVELLNDRYLFDKAEDSVLEEAYSDVIAMMEKEVVEIEEPKGLKGFLAKYLGIAVLGRREEQAYEENEIRKLKIQLMESSVKGIVYPTRLFSIPESRKRQKVETIHYLRRYSIWSLIMMFFSFAFIGWIWEVSLHLVSDGVFVNRGVLHGPWLPIYGTGGVLILVVLNKFRKHAAAQFAATVVLCGVIEYFTAYYLEMTHDGQKWWDYSGYFLNLHGRICAEGLLVFGLGGLAIVYIVAPLIDNKLQKISYSILVPVCVVLVIIFTGDQIYSKKHPNTGEGITDYTGARIEQQNYLRFQQRM